MLLLKAAPLMSLLEFLVHIIARNILLILFVNMTFDPMVVTRQV